MADQSKHQDITQNILRDWDQSEYSRDNGSDDLIFARRTQWNDELDENVSTEYRGQFDIVKPERRRILAALMKNEFSNRYRPKGKENERLAEVLQGLYRATTRTNDAKMAAEVAISEAIDCGTGAWRIEVVDEDERDPLNTNKKLIRSVIHEANNKVVWDANSKKIDKSDAKRCTIAFSLAEHAWKELMEEYGLGEVEPGFSMPEYCKNSSLYWRTSDNYTIAEHYEIKEKKQKIILMSNGERVIPLTTGELRKRGDILREQGFEKQTTKVVIKPTVWKTILTGAHILDSYKIAGRHIPVVSVFGEWSITQGVESWEGLVRMLRDPQQMKNTTLSYIFDLLAKGPVEKDIYAQEQIEGYEEMYEQQNSHDSPYYLQNLLDSQGNELPLGPLGKKGGPQVPQAAQFLLGAADQAVGQSVGGGVTPEQMINPQVTNDQLQSVRQQLDIQAQLYKDHLEYAYRREGKICASIWSEIIDNEQVLDIIEKDGTESTVEVNKMSTDFAKMDNPIEIDMSNADMDVFTDVGPSFAEEKGKVRNEMMALLEKPIDPQDQKIAQWTYIMNLEGSAYEPMRKNARKQMVLGGYIEGEMLTDDDKEILEAESQKPQQPDPMMVAAQAEQEKAVAANKEADNKTQQVQMDAQVKMADIEHRNRVLDLDVQKFMREKDDKYNVEAAKIQQNQQKIDDDRADKQAKNAIEISKLELEAGRDLNAELQNNMLVFDPTIGDFA